MYMSLGYFSKYHPWCLAELKIVKRNPFMVVSCYYPDWFFFRKMKNLEKCGDSHCVLDYQCRLLWSWTYGNNWIWCEEGEGILYSN